MKLLQIFCVLVLLTLTLRCAKQSHPTGGEKDETPPLLIQTNPPDKQTNFNKNEIELSFNEAIQVNNAREQIIITPSIGKKFEATYRKNKVFLKLNAELLENTTYTISFRDAIQDLTERNPAVNLKLAFSTGDYIDSLSIKGIVYDLLEGKPVKNFIVAAAPYSDTLNILEHEAQWITLTNSDGEYTLDNLKAGSYILYAFDDKNKNLIVDSKSERFGFMAEPIALDSNISNLKIPIVKLDSRPIKLISAKPIASTFNIRFNKGFATYSLHPFDSTLVLFSMPEDEATIRIYNPFVEADSIPVNLIAKDSLDHTIDTLLYLKYETRLRPERFQAKIGEVLYHKNTSILKTSITFNKPVAHLYTDSVYIQLDSTTFIRFTAEEFKWNNYLTQLTLEKKLPKETDFSARPQTTTQAPQRKDQPKKEDSAELTTQKPPVYNQLQVMESAFISVQFDSSGYLKSPINTITPENSGVLLVEVSAKEKVLIQLISKGNQIIAQSSQHASKFDNLPPGDYMIRVILDKNGNAKWDPSNYLTKTEPELILYYQNDKGSKNVTLKANWEVGPLFITPAQHVENKN